MSPAESALRNLSKNDLCLHRVLVGGKRITSVVAAPASETSNAIDTFEINKLVSIFIITP